MPSIIVLDKLSPDGLALLDAASRLGISYEVKTGLSGEELKNVLASHDGAICRSGVKISRCFLKHKTSKEYQLL